MHRVPNPPAPAIAHVPIYSPFAAISRRAGRTPGRRPGRSMVPDRLPCPATMKGVAERRHVDHCVNRHYLPVTVPFASPYNLESIRILMRGKKGRESWARVAIDRGKIWLTHCEPRRPKFAPPCVELDHQ